MISGQRYSVTFVSGVRHSTISLSSFSLILNWKKIKNFLDECVIRNKKRTFEGLRGKSKRVNRDRLMHCKRRKLVLAHLNTVLLIEDKILEVKLANYTV